jgi:hypothetical protein
MVEKLMGDLGKDSAQARSLIDKAVGDITKDLLSQDGGRFFGLEKYQDITISTTETRYILNKDFNTIRSKAVRLSSTQVFLGDFFVVSFDDFFERQADTSVYPGQYYGRIEKLDSGPSGAGMYLIIGDVPDKTSYIRVFYFRKPTENDSDLIRNEFILETGAKSQLKSLNPDWELHLKIYFKMREGFREHIARQVNELSFKPSRRTQGHNARQYKIGRGN